MVNSFEDIPARDRVIVALDCGIEEAFDLADQLQGKATWMKVGMTLFYANGPAIVYALKERGFKVFLDLKFHDIPHQVAVSYTHLDVYKRQGTRPGGERLPSRWRAR